MQKNLLFLIILCIALPSMAQQHLQRNQKPEMVRFTEPEGWAIPVYGNLSDYYRPAKSDTNNLYYYVKSLHYDNVPITKPVFEQAEDFDAAGYALVKLKGKYGFIDTTGKIVIPCVYDNATRFSDDIAIVFTDCKTALLNRAGTLSFLEHEYEYVHPFSCHRAIVEHNGKYGLIDTKGHEVVAPQYFYLADFVDDMAIVQDTFGIKAHYGAIDTTGKQVYPIVYDYIYSFKNGLAVICKNRQEGEGACDKQGNIIIPMRYDDILKYADEDDTLRPYIVAGVYYRKKIFKRSYNPTDWDGRHRYFNYKTPKTKQTDLYDSNGKLLYTFKGPVTNISSQLGFIHNKKQIVFVHADGSQTVLPGLHLNNYYSYYSRLKFTVYTNHNKCGVLANTGKLLIPAVYNKIEYANAGDILAYKNDSIDIYNWGYEKVKSLPGNYLWPFNLHINSYTTAKYYIVKSGKLYGVVDSAFTQILPCIYELIAVDAYNSIYYKQRGKWGVLDASFKPLIPPLYSVLRETDFGFLYKEKGKYGLLDFDGKPLLKPVYDEIEQFTYIMHRNRSVVQCTESTFKVKVGRNYGLVDEYEKQLLPIKHKYIDKAGSLYIGYIKNKAALYNRQGQAISGYVYDALETDEIGYTWDNPKYPNKPYYTANQYIQAKKNGLWGIIDSANRTIAPFVYINIDMSNIAGQYIVTAHGKMGVMDTTGKLVMDTLYKDISPLYNNPGYEVELNDKVGIFDSYGDTILPIQYSNIGEIGKDLFYLYQKPDAKTELIGVANKYGKVIIQPEYKIDQIDYYRETIILTVDGKRYFYNALGEPVNDCYIDKHIGDD